LNDLRRRLADLGPRARWALAGSLLAALVAAGYYVSSSEAVGNVWLYEQSFSGDEAARMVAVLERAGIPCGESGGRISVPADRKADARTALAKERVGPRSFDEHLEDFANSSNILEDPATRENRELVIRGRLIAEAIRELPGVVAADVWLSPVVPPSGRSLVRDDRRYLATIFVESDPGQLLARSTVRSIRDLAFSMMPGVGDDGVTLVDRKKGHEYIVAGKPDVVARSEVSGREEEIRARILEILHYIDEAKVVVRIDPPTSAAAAPAKAGEPAIAANQPLTEPASAPAPLGKATVLISVPRAYLIRLYHRAHPNRLPSAEELMPIATRANETIRSNVGTILAEEDLGRLKIDWFDEPGPVRPSSEESESRKALPPWLPIAVGGALAALGLTALGGLLAAARRPAARMRPSPPVRREPTGLVDGDASGPSERVRELVRMDPAAAAGVLHRWIAQGGRAV
jgi:type III secretory pathway lipoprotein EscJ